ncbi:MAG: hypothetical protein KKA32_06815 [Actinobacteria bacterium]|nr:hypothetical protein [Actinomycetota bacterium]
MRSSVTKAVVDETPSRNQERALAVTAGPLGGVELRPSRAFLWLGDRAAAREWVLPIDAHPRLLRGARRRRHVDIGPCSVSYLGNPALTLGLFAFRAARKALGRGK